MKTIKDLDIVALTEDLEATHFETKQIIKLSEIWVEDPILLGRL
ncbi:hypothetical protein QUB10_10950 [Microcoleus sp. B5-D4]